MKQSSIYFLCLVFILTSCGEYNKVLKNPSLEVKYTYAKKYFDQGKYNRAATLLEDVVPMFKGTSYAQESLYLLAQSYYEMKDYGTATQYFTTYFKTYPKGDFTELARFYAAYGQYLDSPIPQLDQAQTYDAIKLFQEFLEYYPQSERKDEANRVLFELYEKLAAKELLAVRLYYNLGNYVVGYPFPGGNYMSCVITAQNALKDFPYSKYKEDFMYFSIRARFDMAKSSVDEKKSLRYRDVIDEYYSYVNDFPTGKYLKQVEKIFEQAEKAVRN